MKKLIRKLDSKIIAAKLMLDEFISKEDGMETLEMAIVVMIGLVIAGIVVTVIGKNKDEGLLAKIFGNIDTAITDIFG